MAKSAAHKSAAQSRKPKCAICGADGELEFRPFCSRRCADVDLSRWLRGAYAIPGQLEGDEDGDDTAAASGVVRDPQSSDPDDTSA